MYDGCNEVLSGSSHGLIAVGPAFVILAPDAEKNGFIMLGQHVHK